MISKAILDTNYIVGLIDARDVWHDTSISIEEKLISENIQLLFLDCVINEVINVIVRRFNERNRHGEISECIEKLHSVSPKEAITWMYPEIEKFYNPVIDTVKNSNGILNFHDAFIVHIAGELGITHIVSFDKGFDTTELRRIKNIGDIL